MATFHRSFDRCIAVFLTSLYFVISPINAFTPVVEQRYVSNGCTGRRTPTTWMKKRADNNVDKADSKSGRMDDNQVEEYRNVATRVLSNFMPKNDEEETIDQLASIDFDAPKLPKLPLETLAQLLDADLYESEWFVSGKVNPCYFAESFKFQDPDVKVSGIEEYARGVNKLFDQRTARAEIISTTVNQDTPNTITCTWRLSGNVSIGPGLTIKPYIVYTDFTVDPESGLIVFQQDRFDSPQWDILLSSLFPWTIGRITAPPAPPVEPRVVKRPVVPSAGTGPLNGNPFDELSRAFSKMFS
ncbi:hypothetical protein MPSEU_000886700 [Mayamaea pseudoterrestris]|nr:hypothetical protein MPSEU_000886700 [Mayamaea pseudoterrestris]